MRSLAPLSAGLLGGLTLVVGSILSGINAQPGATIRVAQSVGIDAALGPAQRIQAPSGPLYTWEHGPPGGPEVVLVHGFGDAGAGWVPTAMVLGKTHHVRMLDLPGHGRSAPHGAALTMEQLESGLSAVMDATEGKVVLVGNSLGGWLSARYALAHPDRVEHLVLVNNAGLSQDIPRDLLLPATMARQVEKNRAILGEHTVELPGFALRGCSSSTTIHACTCSSTSCRKATTTSTGACKTWKCRSPWSGARQTPSFPPTATCPACSRPCRTPRP